MQEDSRTKNSIKNILGGIIFRVIGIVFSFVIKTIIVWTLGRTYLGLNSLFASILSVLSLTELGIGSAMVYNMYKPVAEKDYELLSALLNTYKKLYRIIGIVILVIGLAILPFLKTFISGGASYAKVIKNCVNFGTTMEGREYVAHQKNEYIDIDDMKQVLEIYLEAIKSISNL